MIHTLKSVHALAATLITFGSLAGGANAAIILTTFTVNQSGHILDGATFTATTEDATQWSALGDRVYAGTSQTTVNISGAIGVGAAWNGLYSYQNGENIGYGDTVPGVGGVVFGPTSYNSGASLPAIFGDGLGNNFRFRANIIEGAIAPTIGSLVVSENFAGVSSFFNFSSTGGSNQQWTQPAGTAAITVIPEPSTLVLFGLATLGLVARRRRTT